MARLASMANPANVEGMARYGINSSDAWGVPMPVLRGIARDIGKDHELALSLWTSGRHEARILACLIDLPERVTEEQMETWVRDFDSWDICDQCCSNLFDKTLLAFIKACEWSWKDEEFVKRAGFVLMAALAVHDKGASDEQFIAFLPIIRDEAIDGRNFVKKAINWALRQIGKRDADLNQAAIRIAEEIRRLDSKDARWIANDALRELTGEKVQGRFRS